MGWKNMAGKEKAEPETGSAENGATEGMRQAAAAETTEEEVHPVQVGRPETQREIRLTTMQKDALKEVSNLGSAKATNTLSDIIGQSVKLTVPYVQLMPIEQLQSLIGGPHEIIAATVSNLWKGHKGVFLIAFKRRTAARLVGLMKREASAAPTPIEEMDLSAFIELAHILNNAYLNPLANFFSEKFAPEPTRVILDVASVMRDLLGVLPNKVQYGLLIGTDFSLPGEEETEGKIIFLLDEAALEKLLDSLDKRVEIRKGKIF